MYERFENRRIMYRGPAMAIRPEGRLRLNSAAAALLKDAGATRVWILWDRDRLRIALKPAEQSEVKAFKLGSGSNSSTDISVKAFLKHIGWSASEPFSTPVEWVKQNGILEAINPLPKEFVGGSKKAGRRGGKPTES